MSTPSAKLMVFVSGNSACIKITGRANFASSIDFKTLFNGLLAKDYNCFVLDLGDCLLMDSTFLGVLAGFGLQISHVSGTGKDFSIQLLNPNARISDLLENLGVIHLFRVISGAAPLPEATQGEIAPSSNPSHEQVTRTCLEAHELLMGISPSNVAKFKDVAQFLAEDLKKTKPGT